MNIENKSIKNELIYFKEEVLKDVRFELSKITSKIDNQKDSFSEKIISFESKLTSMMEKIISLSNKILEDKSIKEKITKLFDFHQNTKEILILHDSKIKTLSKNLVDSINRIDLFLNNNILYHDVIGTTPNCKFKNFHNFIDYVIKNITQLNKFKESIISLDIKNYKIKIDNHIESLRSQFINSSDDNKKYTKSLMEKEEKNRELIEQKIDEIKMENTNNIDNLKSQLGVIEKELEKINIIKNEIHERIDKELLNIDKKNNQFSSNLEEYRKKYMEQNNILKKSIKEIYNQIERLVFKSINSNKNTFYYIPKGKKEEINDIKYDAIETEQQKITSRKNEDIKKGNNSFREIFEDRKEVKKEELKEELKDELKEEIKEEKREEKKYYINRKNKIISRESLLKPYIEGKINYEQAFNIKKLKKNKILDNKRIKELKQLPLDSNINNNIHMNYSDIVNNIFNNPEIKNIYNTKFKEVQTFIDKIIIGSVLNTNIKTKKTKIKNNVSSDFLNQKLKLNRNLKFDEISNLTNKEHLSSYKNEIKNDKQYDSNKDDINNKKNDTLLIPKKRKNSDVDKYINQKIEKSILKEKDNFYSILLNNDSSDNTLCIDNSINIQKMPYIKNVRTQNDIKKTTSFDIEKNNTSNNNYYFDIMKDNEKQTILPEHNNSQIEKDRNIISIINFKNKTQPHTKKSKSKLDLSMPNLFENSQNYGAQKQQKNIILKSDKKSINNKFKVISLSNKIQNNSSAYFDSEHNIYHTQKDLEYIAKKQIEIRLKKSDNK